MSRENSVFPPGGTSEFDIAWMPALWLNNRMINRPAFLLFFLVAAAACCRAVHAGIAQTSPPGIALIRGTTSTPNDAERKYAESVTQRLDRWLSEMGVPHLVVDDEDVASRTIAGSRLAILGYNPCPTTRELGALKSFTDGGGALLVFYSASPELAGLLNMRLGEYMAAKRDTPWRAIKFNDSAPVGFPKVVRQESRNIRPVFPAGSNSKVIACWSAGADKNNAGAENGTVPALTQSDHGAWMSHVLLDDGDTENKKRMLLCLIGLYEPGVWRFAARHGVERSARLLAKCRRRAASGVSRATAMLSEAGAIYDRICRLLDESDGAERAGTDPSKRDAGERKYREAFLLTGALDQLLVGAYAVASATSQGVGAGAREHELRGVWDHSGTGLYPGDWNRTCGILADYGITDIMSNVMWPGAAHYESKTIPQSETFRMYGDQLAQCLAAAHRYRLRVHVWKICWKLDGAPSHFIEQMRRLKRLQVSDAGETINWLCPSHPDNFRWEKDGIREMLRNYDVDGIHFDYIRYQDSHFCYCAGCRSLFEKELGRPLSNWPSDARRGSMKEKYSDWRCRQIERLVRDVSAFARNMRPGIMVSAAVFGKYPECVASVAQDWVAWLNKGYADFVCPMNYTADSDKFSALVRAQTALPLASGRLYPGLGVTALESRLDPALVIDQISALREEGVKGFVFFDLDRVLEMEILPALSPLLLNAPAQSEASMER